MPSQAQNALLQSIFANTGIPVEEQVDQDPAFGSGAFSVVLDPAVRERLLKEAKDNKLKAEMVPPGLPPQPSAAANNSFARNFSVPGTSAEDRARRNDMELQFKELLAQQQAGIDKQDQAIADMKASAKPEWVTPAAAFLDQTYGGNQAEAAKQWSGMTAQERAKAIQEMEQAQNSQRAQMSNQVKSLLDSNNAMEIANKNSRFQQGQDMRLNMAFDKSVQAATKGAWESIASIGAIEKVFGRPDGMVPVGEARAMLSNASRLLGERGVLTDSDIERVQINTLLSTIKSLETKLTGQGDNALVPVSNYATLVNAISKSKQSMGSAVQQRLGAIGDSYLTYGIRPEVVDQVINKNYMPKIQGSFNSGPPQSTQTQVPTSSAAAPSSKPPPGLSMQQLMEWRRANGR